MPATTTVSTGTKPVGPSISPIVGCGEPESRRRQPRSARSVSQLPHICTTTSHPHQPTCCSSDSITTTTSSTQTPNAENKWHHLPPIRPSSNPSSAPRASVKPPTAANVKKTIPNRLPTHRPPSQTQHLQPFPRQPPKTTSHQ